SYEGWIYSASCKFIPFYKLYYIYSRWRIMREHFIFYALGSILLWPGLVLLRLPDEAEIEEPEPTAAVQVAPRPRREADRDPPPPRRHERGVEAGPAAPAPPGDRETRSTDRPDR